MYLALDAIRNIESKVQCGVRHARVRHAERCQPHRGGVVLRRLLARSPRIAAALRLLHESATRKKVRRREICRGMYVCTTMLSSASDREICLSATTGRADAHQAAPTMTAVQL